MRAAFDQELTELQARLVELGAMVQAQLDHTLAALATGDRDAIPGVVGGDRQIDQARVIPELVERSPPADVQATLTRMGGAVSKVVNAALACFADSDSAGAERLPALDAAVDQLNDGIFRQLEQTTDPTAVAWATRLVLIARFLERLGDQAVDVGEQVCFIVTGEVRELQPPKAARTSASPR